MTDKDNTDDLPIRCRPAHVAKHFGVSIPTLYRWVSKGILPPPKKLAPSITLWDRKAILDAFDNAPLANITAGKKPELT